MTPERKEKLLKVISQRQFNLTVILENVHDPHNISAVMRTCDAVGIQEVYVLNTKIEMPKKWGKRSSSSALKWLTILTYNNLDECISDVRKKYSKIYTTHLADDSIQLHEINFVESIALVFGNEKDGVSNDMRNTADGNFIIPQVGIIQSLNISVACAVSIYEAFRQKNIANHYQNNFEQFKHEKELLINKWEIQ
jgi:tRNA (guanosine-2'-O-)-methyltransferase